MSNKHISQRAIDQVTPKQKIFLHHYIQQGCHGARAWMAMNPRSSRQVADSSASRMLSLVKVKAALAELCNDALDGDTASLKLLIRNTLETIAQGDIGDYITWDENGVYIKPSKGKNTRSVRAVKMTKDIRHTKEGDSIETVKIEVSLKDDIEALDKLAKILGMYSDGSVHTGDVIYVNAPGTEEWDGRTE